MSHIPVGGLVTLYTLAQLVLCMGPNCTTFLMPAEVFPTRVRGTAHGIAAASGKAGAILTSFAFGTVVERIGLKGILALFSGIMALVALVTLWIPETKGLSIQDIENDKMYTGERTPEIAGAEETCMDTPSTIMKGTDPAGDVERQDLV